MFWGLAALLALEAAAVATVAAVLLFDLVVAEPASLATALALTVLVLIAVAWIAVTIVGVPLALVVGVVTAILFRRSGSVWTCVIVHMMYNGISNVGFFVVA